MSSVSDLISELGDHGFTDTSTARKVSVINDSIWEICGREPWPFLEKSIDLNFDGSSATPSNFPSDFRAALKVVRIDNGLRIPYMRLDDAEEMFATELTEAGDPYAFYFLAGSMKFVRIPAAATGLLRMRYIHTPAAVTSGTAEAGIIIPARHHRAILLGALWKLYDMEDDIELAQRFQGNFEKRMNDMRQDLWARQYDSPDYIHVFDTDDNL